MNDDLKFYQPPPVFMTARHSDFYAKLNSNSYVFHQRKPA